MVLRDSPDHKSNSQPDKIAGVPEVDAGYLASHVWAAAEADRSGMKLPSAETQRMSSMWKTPTITYDELDFMTTRGRLANAKEAETIKGQISKYAADPEQSLLSAVEKSRVVGFADLHVRHAPYFQFLEDEMPKLKQSGITHLAVEVPEEWQDKVDRFSDTDKLVMKARLTDGNSLLEVIAAAKQAGIEVTAVDSYYKGMGDTISGRDAKMASNIKDILKDDKAKVLYFVGAEHLMRGERVQTGLPSTAELLRQDGVPMTTFYQQIPSMPDGLMMSARDLVKPINVDTSLADLMATVRTAGVGLPPYRNWDNVLFYPPHYKMEKVEGEFAKIASPAKQALLDSVHDNRVIVLGEMDRHDPETPESQNRKFMAEMIPELKRAGITDLALDIPVDYQKRLDEIARDGIPTDTLGLGARFGPSFRPVLQAAMDAKIRLHAIGQSYTDQTPLQTVLDGLTSRAAEIEQQNTDAKTLVWTNDLFAAKFSSPSLGDVSVANSLRQAGIKATSFGDYSQTFDKFSPSLLNGLVQKPMALDASDTTLGDVLNSRAIPMERYDHVIVYPIK